MQMLLHLNHQGYSYDMYTKEIKKHKRVILLALGYMCITQG